jgi:hypothetical protein
LSNTSKKAKNPKLVHRPNSSKTSKRKKAWIAAIITIIYQ